ncbi:MAG: hypothetical protein ACRENF_01470, partial [Thermodesulfobacteriota bacterium]
MYAAVGESEKAQETLLLCNAAAQSVFLIPEYQIWPALTNILCLLNNDDLRGACSVYLASRASFIKSFPIIGCWLSMLFQAYRVTQLSEDQMVFFPRKASDSCVNQSLTFFQGAFLVWTDHGKRNLSLTALKCLRRIYHLGESQEKGFFFRLIRTCDPKKISWEIWEQVGDIAADSEMHEIEVEAYVKALTAQVCLPLKNQIFIATKLSRALIFVKNVNLQTLNLPFNIMNDNRSKMAQYPVFLTALVELALSHDLKDFYADLLALLTIASLRTGCEEVQAVLAYAHYRLGNAQEALRIIGRNSSSISWNAAGWLRDYSKKEFNAIPIYSLLL